MRKYIVLFALCFSVMLVSAINKPNERQNISPPLWDQAIVDAPQAVVVSPVVAQDLAFLRSLDLPTGYTVNRIIVGSDGLYPLPPNLAQANLYTYYLKTIRSNQQTNYAVITKIRRQSTLKSNLPNPTTVAFLSARKLRTQYIE